MKSTVMSRQYVREFVTAPRGFLGFLVAIFVLPLVVTVGLATEILLLGIFALSYNLMFGFTGLLSFGHALFLGFGAYAAGLIVIHLGFPIIPTIAIVLVLALLLSLLVGLISIRLSGIAFAMVTLAFAQLGYELAIQLRSITGGADGLLGIYRPSLFGLGVFDINDRLTFYAFCALFAVLCVGYTYLLSRSLFGRTLTAVRTNEERTAALGVNTYRVKVAIFTIAGAMAAIAGALWSFYLQFISPEVLFWTYTGDAILYTLIGGMHSVMGPILGAGFLRSAERMLFPTDPGYWNVVIGTIFVLIVLFKRGGLVAILEQLFDRLSGELRQRR